MNEEAFEELMQKAAIAKRLVEEIRTLEAADPKDRSHHVSFSKNGTYGHEEIMGESFLRRVIEAGRLKLIADNEAELDQLLQPRIIVLHADPPQPAPLDGVWINAEVTAPTEEEPKDLSKPQDTPWGTPQLVEFGGQARAS